MTHASTETALAIPAQNELAALFHSNGGLEDIIARIESEARSHAPDVSSKKGRDAIASLAYKVARSKTALDDAGKALNEAARRQIDAVDSERRAIRARLDALRDEVRAPLDAWEAAERERVDGLQQRIARLRGATPQEDTAAAYEVLMQRVRAVSIDDTWAEFVAEAAKAKDETLLRLENARNAAKIREDQEAEIARLRAEADRREAEERARAAAEAERARLIEVERMKAEAADRAAREAEERAKAAAEAERQAAAQREADLLRKVAEAEAREKAAAQAERDRIAEQEAATTAARLKRESDARHRARIQSEIAEALEAYEAVGAMVLADAIIGGAIPHVRAVL